MSAFFKNLSSRKVLLLSLLSNIVLCVFCFLLFAELKKTYIDYRHFRALKIGISQATNANPKANTIVLFGDSRIETWEPKPTSDTYRFVNAGVAGETTTEMRRRFEHDVVRLKPDYVLIQAGVNDLTAAVTKKIPEPDALVSSMHENLTYFIATLEDQGIDVIVSSILPVKALGIKRKALWTDTLTEQVNQANRTLEHTTRELGADWFNLDAIYLDDSGNTVNNLYYDTLHISHGGYEVLNQHFDRYLKNL